MSMEYFVDRELTGETEVLVGNLPQCHFSHHKSHMSWPEKELGPPRWEVATKSLSYYTANMKFNAYRSFW
jgi:hypothetical protein